MEQGNRRGIARPVRALASVQTAKAYRRHCARTNAPTISTAHGSTPAIWPRRRRCRPCSRPVLKDFPCSVSSWWRTFCGQHPCGRTVAWLSLDNIANFHCHGGSGGSQAGVHPWPCQPGTLYGGIGRNFPMAFPSADVSLHRVEGLARPPFAGHRLIVAHGPDRAALQSAKAAKTD